LLKLNFHFKKYSPKIGHGSVAPSVDWDRRPWAQIFYRTKAVPVTKPTVSKHWRKLKALTQTKWPGLILSSSTSRLVHEGVLIPLWWLSNG